MSGKIGLYFYSQFVLTCVTNVTNTDISVTAPMRGTEALLAV